MSGNSPDCLNYQHLFYFLHVAREGSIARACDKLHLAQPTISIQIQKLERNLGAKLFTRTGRRLILTETGQMVYRHAEEIFALGQELTEVVKGRRADRPLRLTVGVPDVLPKLAVFRLLLPALEMKDEVRLVVHEGKLDHLLADLAMHHLDVVLADAPCTAATRIRAFNHLLGDCGVTVFGTKTLARKYARNFPASLDGAPMLLPTENTSMRRSLEQWFHESNIHPRVVHELEDSALLKVFGQAGQGIFCAPTAVEQEVERRYHVRVIGRLDAVRERFFAISVERRLKHPAVLAISQAARQELFAPPNEDQAKTLSKEANDKAAYGDE